MNNGAKRDKLSIRSHARAAANPVKGSGAFGSGRRRLFLLARFCAVALTAASAATGLFLFVVSLLDQGKRLTLYLHHGIGFADPACGAAFCDASVFWLAGLLGRRGAVATLYHPAAFAAFGAAVLPGHLGHLPFVYTPVTLLPAALLSLPPLAAGYFAFIAISIATAILLLRRAGFGWAPIVAGLVGPAAMWSLYLGQFGLLCGVLLLAGLARLERRPMEGGLWLGLLAVKPQYTLAAPVAVLAGRHWRATAAGVLTLLTLVLISAACFGWPAWAEFFGPGRAAARLLLVTPFAHGTPVLGVSVFWMLRSLGAGLGAASAVQAVVFAAAVLGLWRLWRRPVADPAARLVATLCLTLLASPYAYTDDMAGLSFALAACWRRDAPFANAVFAVVWLSPALTGHFLHSFGFLPEPLLVAAALAIALGRVSPRGACICPSASPPSARHAAPSRGPTATDWS